MSSWKKFMGWAKILTVAFALSLVMFCLPTTAMAFSCSPDLRTSSGGIPSAMIDIKQPTFDVTSKSCLTSTSKIRSVKVSLEPKTATGKIDKIEITGPNGREFGCNPGTVSNGINLIKTCGGPAILEPGETTYHAMGGGFGSDPVKLKVEFSPDF